MITDHRTWEYSGAFVQLREKYCKVGCVSHVASDFAFSLLEVSNEYDKSWVTSGAEQG